MQPTTGNPFSVDHHNGDRSLITLAREEAQQLAEASSGRCGPEGDAADARPLVSVPGYDLLHEVRRGAQGIVYEAIEHGTGERVAVKVLRDGPFATGEGHARFEREVQILRTLDHPNIAAVRAGGDADGHYFYVMDFIDGRPVDAYIRDEALALDETVRLFIRIADAVHAAHLRGVIHRDLKPGNILIDDDGEPHVLDFGLAKIAPETSLAGDRTAVTATGQVVGSLPWASPEQARGDSRAIDLRTDVYALGALLYQATTGRLPHDVDGPLHEVLHGITTEAPARPRALRRDISADLETIILTCLSKSPQRRYDSAGALARDLQRLLAGDAIEARRDSAWYVLSKTLRRHRALTTAAGLALMAGIAFGATMTALYQQADDARVRAEQENESLREELDQLKQQLVSPGNWTTTFASAEAMKSIPPEEGWRLMRDAWAEMTDDRPKQQLMKAARVGEHPYLVEVLHLGVTDPSPAVQSWALNSLRDVAFIDFSVDFSAYEPWRERFAGQPAEAIITAGVLDLIERLRAADAPQRSELFESLRNNHTLRDWPAAARAAYDAGLADDLLEALQDPALSPEARSAAGRMLPDLPLTEAQARQRVLPLLDSDEASGAVARTAIDVLGGIDADWALDALLDHMVTTLREKDASRHASLDLSNLAQAIAEHNDPRAIPTMIGVIAADNSYDTIYGVGWFGLGRLTGVDYDESHDGAWWRQWWADNKQRFSPDVQALPVPDLPKTKAGREYEQRQAEGEPTLDAVVAELRAAVEAGDTSETFNLARQLAEQRRLDAIPAMIAIIDSDNTYTSVYGIGYFGLGRLVGVDYDESHDGAWWRQWWADNRSRFPEELAAREIPDFGTAEAQPTPEAVSEQHGEPPVQDLLAGGEPMKRYFLIGPWNIDAAPENGWKLLLVLPGGDGSADFHPFVTNIYRQAVPEGYLVAQLIAPQWSADQAQHIVWPTQGSPWEGMRFSTEQFIASVVDDVAARYDIDDRHVHALGWSSGGPPIYAATAAEDSPLTGAFIAMSVYKTNYLSDPQRVAGKAFYVLHSPQDQMIPMHWPNLARDELAEFGATTVLETYRGGHGWHGDVYGIIRRGLDWLNDRIRRDAAGDGA